MLLAQLAYGEETDAHYPEPLAFDMVRGLGARAGEVEMNTLASTEWNGLQWTSRWGPELEVAAIDGLAFEIELPHVGERLDSVKAAAQLTLPKWFQPIGHGLLAIYDRELAVASHTADLLYLLGWRSDQWSGIAMFGARGEFAPSREPEWSSLLNVSVFADVGSTTTAGVETNLRAGKRGVDKLMVLPQLQQAFGEHLSLQAGAGVVWRNGSAASPMGSLRVIVQ